MRILSQCPINPLAVLYLPNPYYSLVKFVKAELCNRLTSLGKASDAAKGSILYELRISTPKSLKQSRVILAAIAEQDYQASLVFKWIEKYPSPDAYRIISESSQYKGTWKIQDGNHQYNRKRYERDLVLFTGLYAWRPDNKEWAGNWDEWLSLKKALVSGNCKIVLLKDGKVVSNAFPVKYIEGSALKKKTSKQSSTRR